MSAGCFRSRGCRARGPTPGSKSGTGRFTSRAVGVRNAAVTSVGMMTAVGTNNVVTPDGATTTAATDLTKTAVAAMGNGAETRNGRRVLGATEITTEGPRPAAGDCFCGGARGQEAFEVDSLAKQRVAFRHASAVGIHEAETELGDGVALIG